MPFSTIRHIQTRIPARLLQSGSDGVPNNASSLFSLFGCVLKCFSKLKSLETVETTLPEPKGLDGSVPFGGFGQHVTRLELSTLGCMATTMMSLILSLPNIQELLLDNVEVVGEVSVPLEGS